MDNEFVRIDELISRLKEEGLLIVDRRLLIDNKPDVDKLLTKRSLTLKEIADSGILPISSKQAVRNWIASGKINPDAVFKDKSGKIKVATAEIKRLKDFYYE